MPGGRTRYNPGLPGGGRTRYIGEDAYANQQRENETRATTPPMSRFMAPVWQVANAPGASLFWYVDFSPGTPNWTSPYPTNTDNTGLVPSGWEGATLARVSFLDPQVGTQFTGFVPLLEEGFWHVSASMRMTGPAMTYGEAHYYLYPKRLMDNASPFSLTNVYEFWKREVANAAQATAVNTFDVPILEPCYLLVRCQTDVTTSNVQETTLASNTRKLRFDSFVSGFRLP